MAVPTFTLADAIMDRWCRYCLDLNGTDWSSEREEGDSWHHRDSSDPTARRCANLVLRGDTIRVVGRITGQRIPISHCDNANDG